MDTVLGDGWGAEFQSTLPYGSDMRTILSRNLRSIFQSTLPYGSDEDTAESAILRLNFNPRSLTGATIGGIDNGSSKKISIHAPLRERPGL